MHIKVNLDPELFRELEAVSRENELTPQSFATECVEAALAERRLPRVRPHVLRPRVAETAMLDVPREAELRDKRQKLINAEIQLAGVRAALDVPRAAECRAAGPLAAGEIPTTDDLDCLGDIR